jgi:succinate dehydrogenase / fumarate reductase cytochrome b subunit
MFIVRERKGNLESMKVNSFYSRKLHSLLGVIPLGFFLLEHLLTNFEAFYGLEAFSEQIEWLVSLPLVLILEIVGIWLPLLYHGVYGLFIAFQARHNTNNFGYFRNWMFRLQRITGVITLIFVAWHVFETRVQVGLGNVEHADLGMLMHNILSDNLMFTLYLVGVIATAFHFSNGIWAFLVSWGITIGPKSQRISTYATMALFVIFAVMFVISLTSFRGEEFALLQEVVTRVVG